MFFICFCLICQILLYLFYLFSFSFSIQSPPFKKKSPWKPLITKPSPSIWPCFLWLPHSHPLLSWDHSRSIPAQQVPKKIGDPPVVGPTCRNFSCVSFFGRQLVMKKLDISIAGATKWAPCKRNFLHFFDSNLWKTMVVFNAFWCQVWEM